MDKLKKHIRGRGVHIFKRLLNFQRTYPEEAFIKAISQADQYGLYDIHRLENLILKFVTDEFFQLENKYDI